MNTLQTEAPLRRLVVSTFNQRVDSLLTWEDSVSYGIDMEQPYQRGDVWGPVRRRNFTKSLLLGVPIPSLIVNNRWDSQFEHDGWSDERCRAQAIIDGKQRVTTILAFFHDELAVPVSWWRSEHVETAIETPDGPYVTWGGLSRSGQMRFRDRTIGVAEGTFKTLDEEREVFDLVNFGGVPQGERDDDA